MLRIANRICFTTLFWQLSAFADSFLRPKVQLHKGSDGPDTGPTIPLYVTESHDMSTAVAAALFAHPLITCRPDASNITSHNCE